MRNLNKIILLASLFALGLRQLNSQTVPPVGRSHELEIANWNIEWFGKTSAGFGPGNDSLQQRLVKNILKASDIDVWVLCEVSDTGAFGRLMRQIPEYSSVLASYYPEQKTAILYKNNLYKGIYPQLLGTSNKDSFSTGRFPLKLSLVSLTPSPFDTIDIIALHLKANTGNDSLKNLAYQSRQRSAEWLKDYTYELLPDKKFIMAGDWNDDLDVSIFNQLPSSLNPLKRNNGNGYFITDRLSAFHIPTTATYPDAIDHQYISNRLYDYYSKDSVFVWRTDQYISNYANTVSDHFPVISRYNQRNYSIAETHKFKGIIYPNPAEKTIRIESKFRIQSVNLIDFSGKTTALINDGGIYNISQFEKGVYLLEIISEEGVFTEKLSLL